MTFKEFVEFCEGVDELTRRGVRKDDRLSQHFRKWKLLCKERGIHLYHWEDIDRVYNMREAKLGLYVVKILGWTGTIKEHHIKNWNVGINDLDDTVADFGARLARFRQDEEVGNLVLELSAVNQLLDEIASKCPYSHHRIRTGHRSSRKLEDIMLDLFGPASARESKWLARIILRNMKINLSKERAFAFIHRSMNDVFLVRNTLFFTCHEINSHLQMNNCTLPSELFEPKVSMPVAIVSCAKAHGTADAYAKYPRDSVFLEHKYDGERIQVHIDKRNTPEKAFVIYNKSRRDSTRERIECHELILASIGSGLPDCEVTSCIIEGELVIYDEAKQGIEDFGAIRIIEDGIKDAAFKQGIRHFMVIWFDILHLNGESLLKKTLFERRELLTNIIRTRPNYIALSEIRLLSFQGDDAISAFRDYYSSHILKNNIEGLIIKPLNSTYQPGKEVWLKLKKDYIEGLGDTVDFAIIGASFARNTASAFTRNENRIGGLLTKFLVGCRSDSNLDDDIDLPLFKAVFFVETGFTERQLHELNETLHSVAIPKRLCNTLPFRVEFCGSINNYQVDIYFTQPQIFELLGSGFVKESGVYVLRHPRIQKVRNDILLADCISFESLQRRAQDTKVPLEDHEHKRYKRLLEVRDDEKMPHDGSKQVYFFAYVCADVTQEIRLRLRALGEKWTRLDSFAAVKLVAEKISNGVLNAEIHFLYDSDDNDELLQRAKQLKCTAMYFERFNQ